MTIVQISDTHNCHRQLANLPAADVLVHCGDFTDMDISPKYHFFGHAHEAYGTIKHGETTFSNAAILDDHYKMCHQPKVFCL